MKRFISLIILSMILLTGCGKVFMKVGKTPITVNDYNRMKADLKDVYKDMPADKLALYVVQNLVSQKAIEYEAKKENITVTDDEIKSLYGKVKGSTKLQEQDIKDIILSDKLYKKYTSNVTVNDDEIKNFYDTHIDQFRTVDVYRIEVNKKADADKVYEALKNGEDIKTLFNQYAVNVSENNGNVGKFSLGQQIDNFKVIPNTITKPLKSKSGYEVFKTSEVTTKSFTDAKDGIKEALLSQKKATLYAKYIDKWIKEMKEE